MPISTEEIALLIKAYDFAANKHRDQRRKDALESPYINHPIAVAQTLWTTGGIRDSTTLLAGILHDTLEDTDTQAAELEAIFGTSVRAVVEELSDDKSLPKEERKRLQIEQAPKKSQQARLVKLADKICNVRDILQAPPKSWSVDRKIAYIDWAAAVIAGVRGSNPAMEELFDELCRQARQAI
jgi:guanosine-3',5'-bis(diphosphate) 3'-pyrophosphohydrolase